MKNYIEILSKCFLFENVNEESIKKCCEQDGIALIEYSPQDVMQDYKSAQNVGILLNGKATIISGDDGVIIRKLEKDDVYGVAKLFDTPKYLTKVVATSKCTVLALNKDFIEGCIEIDRQIAINYISFLAKKISFLNNKISSYTGKTVENKLYTYLLQLPRNNNQIVLNTDFSAIAKMLGIGRASLYRAFDKLEKDGLIIKNNKEITLKEV
ncbi:MAG: Crp/Fnr family transcriptional regulator [Clostridia bacterium]|nr:Crp/Fnr family transcriptional regulator [Clostridia bacterium]